MNKKEEDSKENKDLKEMPKFRFIQSHESYNTWNCDPIDTRVGYSPLEQVDRDQLL